MNLNLDYAYNGWLLLLGCAALVWLGRRVYKNTNPPVDVSLRTVLTTLRAAAICLILFLIFEPILGLSRIKTEKPVVALLLDASSSMQLKNKGDARSEEVRNLLKQPWLKELSDRFAVQSYRFSSRTESISPRKLDSLQFKGDGTDFNQALNKLREDFADRNFAAALIFSDGVNNVGVDPTLEAEQFPAQIHTVLLGDETPERDAWVEDVLANEVAYAGVKTPLTAIVRSNGMGGRNAKISLYHDGRSVISKNVALPQDLAEEKE